MLAAELQRQKLIDEGQVVVNAADFEDLLAPQQHGPGVPIVLGTHDRRNLRIPGRSVPCSNALRYGGTVRGPACTGSNASASWRPVSRAMIAVANEIGRCDAVAGHDGRVPVSRPALVHNLGLCLRREIIRFVANDRQDIQLPRLQRRVLQDEQHHVPHRLCGEASSSRFQPRRR